ncbi:MAG TPA: multicopper oxidase domain-containing protein [Chloroflexia bacterium]|nr:multicopper oxidase domain-containing protein [Chloroflexia bacterium]
MLVSRLFLKKTWVGVTLGLCALLLSSLTLSSVDGGTAKAQQATSPTNGIVCTTSPSPNPSFTLTAKSGYVTTPDGNVLYMWSYAPGNNDFQLPGPNLCVNEGDTVTVILNNTLPEDVSIIFPGQEDVKANGVTAQPQYDASGNLTSLTNVAAKTSGSVTYSFVAKNPGTYLYESGTDVAKQVDMGLFGALIVRPKDHTNWAYGSADTVFNANNEYIMLLSEVDPDLHSAVESGLNYDVSKVHPRYWMINGRSFPDTIEDNFSPLLPSQPYGALVHMRPQDTSNPDPYLVRYINVGMRNHPFHPHGQSGRVIGRDGHQLKGNLGADLSYEKFLVLVGSSQTWDVTYQWKDAEGFNAATNPIPVTLPAIQNQTIKGGATWYSGSPYLGQQDELLVGNTSFNQCGEYYHVWHSHALNEAANYDTGFGGMFTLQRIDPPGGCPAN